MGADINPPTRGTPQAQLANELERFLRGYGEIEPVQGAESAAIDSQVKNLSLPLSRNIKASSSGTVLDIGAGRGILLQRLSSLEQFVKSPGWTYAASDFDEALEAILSLATKLRLHRRVEVVRLDELHSQWLPSTCSRPTTAIIRNVLHELDIPSIAQLLCTLLNHVQPADTVLIQDLMVMHTAERGNACWVPECLAEALDQLGFSTTHVIEPTAKGNQWFTFERRVSTSLRHSGVEFREYFRLSFAVC
jgi:hypothetical protein